MIAKTFAVLAFIAFAQIVRAQEDPTEELDSRYGGESRGNRGLRLYEGGEEEGRGRGLLLEGGRERQRITNKVVRGRVEIIPTRKTYSNSVQVFKSIKRNNYLQKSRSNVVQNNVIKSTDIHIHTNRKVLEPKTINTIVRKHHTQYIINTQPIKTNINIEREQEIIKPEVKNLVVYQNSESLRRHRLHTIVRHREEHQRLPTIHESTRNGGTEVIGNSVNPGSVELSNGIGSENYENYRKGSRSGGSYGLENRAGEEETSAEE